MDSFDKELNMKTIEIAAAIILSLMTKEHAQSVCRRLSCTARREKFSGFVFAALDMQLSSPSDLFRHQLFSIPSEFSKIPVLQCFATAP